RHAHSTAADRADIAAGSLRERLQHEFRSGAYPVVSWRRRDLSRIQWWAAGANHTLRHAPARPRPAIPRQDTTIACDRRGGRRCRPPRSLLRADAVALGAVSDGQFTEGVHPGAD